MTGRASDRSVWRNPASDVLDCTANEMSPSARRTMFSSTNVLPEPAPPVSQIDGRHRNAPQIGAMAIHPASRRP